MLNRKWIYIVLLFLFLVHTEQAQANSSRSLTINVFSISNGLGLEAHRKIFRKALESLGHKVVDREYAEKPTRMDRRNPADINIYMEIINPEWFDYAKLNWLIPHPEWYKQDLALLDRIDLVLCLTHEADRIFQEMCKNTYFLGFTSFDRYNDRIPKNFDQFLHTAGSSHMKGTHAIVEAWRLNESFPYLTLSWHYLTNPPFIQGNVRWIFAKLPMNDLLHLQNESGVHLCPSETEGFGHYIMEAMSTGAVVVTTDAPPMNEFIKDKRCLVPFEKTEKCELATRYYIAPNDLAMTIDSLRALPKSELKQIGENNRSRYLQLTQEFHSNLESLLNDIQ